MIFSAHRTTSKSRGNRWRIMKIIERFRSNLLADDQPELDYTGKVLRNICRQFILAIYHTDDASDELVYVSTDALAFCAEVADVIIQQDGQANQ